jgi:DNA invertase Pin-like site-specific DNA recombinase
VKTTAIYSRVSTTDQNHDPQRNELGDYCERREWKQVVEYADTISGAKFSRSGLDRLMADVRRGRIERVVVVKLDRLGRSLPHLAQLIGELDAHRVALIASSQSIDTSHDNPAGRLQMHVLMAVAEFERSLIRERTKAGLSAALARGVKLGRRAIVLDAAKREALALWKAAPTSLRDLARRLGVSVGTAKTLAKAAPHEAPGLLHGAPCQLA